MTSSRRGAATACALARRAKSERSEHPPTLPATSPARNRLRLVDVRTMVLDPSVGGGAVAEGRCLGDAPEKIDQLGTGRGRGALHFLRDAGVGVGGPSAESVGAELLRHAPS